MKKLNVMLAGLAVVGLVLVGSPALAAHSDHGCHGCHVPHRALMPDDPGASWGVPLWSNTNDASDLPTFTVYHSDTFDALGTDIGQPDGATKLCLGCHDGSYFVFGFLGPQRVFQVDAAAANATDPVGMSLENSHPVSFTYDTALASATGGGLYDPTTTSSGLGGMIADDLLDSHGKMQCTSCHDVHTTGIGEYMLKYDIEADEDLGEAVMCRVCHNK